MQESQRKKYYREKISNKSVYVVDTHPIKHLPAFTVCPKIEIAKKYFWNLKSEALEYHSNFKEKKIF